MVAPGAKPLTGAWQVSTCGCNWCQRCGACRGPCVACVSGTGGRDTHARGDVALTAKFVCMLLYISFALAPRLRIPPRRLQRRRALCACAYDGAHARARVQACARGTVGQPSVAVACVQPGLGAGLVIVTQHTAPPPCVRGCASALVARHLAGPCTVKPAQHRACCLAFVRVCVVWARMCGSLCLLDRRLALCGACVRSGRGQADTACACATLPPSAQCVVR